MSEIADVEKRLACQQIWGWKMLVVEAKQRKFGWKERE